MVFDIFCQSAVLTLHMDCSGWDDTLWKNPSTVRGQTGLGLFSCVLLEPSSCTLLQGYALLWWDHLPYMCLIPGFIKPTIFHLWSCQQPSVLSSQYTFHPASASPYHCSHPWSSLVALCVPTGPGPSARDHAVDLL